MAASVALGVRKGGLSALSERLLTFMFTQTSTLEGEEEGGGKKEEGGEDSADDHGEEGRSAEGGVCRVLCCANFFVLFMPCSVEEDATKAVLVVENVAAFVRYRVWTVTPARAPGLTRRLGESCTVVR